MTPLERALQYIEFYGWHLFPCHTPIEGGCSCHKADCKHVGKHPRTLKGVLDASNDPVVIRRWWGMWPDANIAIAAGPSGLSILDVDPKHGGEESLHSLVSQHGELPMTPLVLTGGGGAHYYFQALPGLGPGVDILPGLDVRSGTSYVIAPPSLHQSGGRYEWEASQGFEDTALAPWPLWIPKAVRARLDAAPGAPAPDIPEGGRNNWLTRRAGQLRRVGMNISAIRTQLLEENAQRCKPPLEDAEVEQIAGSVLRYDPDPLAQPEVAPDPKKPLFAETRILVPPEDEIDPPPDWLIEKLMHQGCWSTIAGDPKGGKTTFALLVAIGVLTGRDVLGITPRKQGPVMILEAEMPLSQFRAALRRVALGAKVGINELSANSLHYYCGRDFDLSKPDSREKLLAIVREIKPALIILDSSRTVQSRGEDKSEEIKPFLDTCQALRDLGPAVLLIAHLVKTGAGQKGNRSTYEEAYSQRGSGSQLAAQDSTITCRVVSDEDGKVCKITAVHRYAETTKPIYWKLTGERIGEPTLTLTNKPADISRRVTPEEVQEIEAYCREAGQDISLKDIQSEVGCSEKKCRTAARTLCGRGVLEGNGKKTSALRYAWLGYPNARKDNSGHSGHSGQCPDSSSPVQTPATPDSSFVSWPESGVQYGRVQTSTSETPAGRSLDDSTRQPGDDEFEVIA